MAEFQVVAKELERMCNTHNAVSGICGTYKCPLYCEDLCYAQVMVYVHGDDACNLEKVVMSWAAENPEPEYPSWYEYLTDMYPAAWNNIKDKPIPADIAQKLGIEPKEG